MTLTHHKGGHIASETGNDQSRPERKLVYCECGQLALEVWEKGHLVAYQCHQHGFLTHDALVYVSEPHKEDR